MIIANPLYDTAFKFLMEDLESAKSLISTILEEEVEELQFAPQVRTVDKTDVYTHIVQRLDFSAKIKTASGERKNVVIEVQKAGSEEDLMRFRNYLGRQYREKERMPIMTIYFLGFQLQGLERIVVKLPRVYWDPLAKEWITKGHPFAEHLTHESCIIQVSRIPPHTEGQPKSKLESLLNIFNQWNALSTNKRHLVVDEEKIAPEHRHMIKRLHMAAADPALQDQFELEEEIEDTLARGERKALEALEALAAAEAREAEMAAEMAAELAAEREKAEAERQKARHQALASARLMKSANIPVGQIAQATGLTAEEVDNL